MAAFVFVVVVRINKPLNFKEIFADSRVISDLVSRKTFMKTDLYFLLTGPKDKQRLCWCLKVYLDGIL